ncbi:MAG: hypothetical protein IPP97_22040 [Candidatus Obscuribacter sp.]|nr:hypothetical protein [Candidatus Obscuribacter sp.]
MQTGYFLACASEHAPGGFGLFQSAIKESLYQKFNIRQGQAQLMGDFGNPGIFTPAGLPGVEALLLTSGTIFDTTGLWIDTER